MALTATLCPDLQTDTVSRFLGMQDYWLIRRSNARYDVRWILRTMSSGKTAIRFPELDWVLQGDRRVVIFCDTIALSHRVSTYLVVRAKDFPDCEDRVRVSTSLSTGTYMDRTLELLCTDSDTRGRV